MAYKYLQLYPCLNILTIYSSIWSRLSLAVASGNKFSEESSLYICIKVQTNGNLNSCVLPFVFSTNKPFSIALMWLLSLRGRYCDGCWLFSTRFNYVCGKESMCIRLPFNQTKPLLNQCKICMRVCVSKAKLNDPLLTVSMFTIKKYMNDHTAWIE